MRIIVTVTSVAIFLAGCVSNDTQRQDDFESSFAKPVGDVAQTEGVELNLNDQQTEDGIPDMENITSMVTTSPKGIQLSVHSIEFDNDELVSFSTEGMPLGEFINYILAEILDVNFVIDPNLAGLNDRTVVLNLSDKMTKKEFFKIFSETLLTYDISLVRKDNLFFVYQASNRGHFDKIKVGIGNKVSDLPTDGEIVYQLVPLTFAKPTAIKALVTQLTLATANPMQDQRYVVVQGYKNDVVRALKVIEYLDVPASIGKYIQFMGLNYIEPFEFIEKLDELLTIEGINFGVTVKVTPLPRHNGFVIHSENPELIERVRFWKEKLDSSNATGKQRYMLYFPQNSKASELGKGITKLLALSSQGGGSVAPQTSASTANSGSGATQAPVARPSSSASFSSDELSMVSDDNRNALIFYTSPAKYRSLLPIIKQLDVLPSQVMVEAKFIEVTLTDKFSNGVEWAISNALNKNSKDPTYRFSNGSFTFNVSDLDYTFALNFLKQDSKVKVLSSPRVLVTDGKSASITVGTEVPVLSNQSNDVNTDRVLQSVQYRSTGVNLSISPTINSRGIVSLNINQSVSETSTNSSSGLDSPLILNRAITTDVIAQSGKSIILGGLIRENKSKSDNGVPLLRDLPVLGNLFSSSADSVERTELVLMITPRIVHNSDHLDEVSTIFKQDLSLF